MDAYFSTKDDVPHLGPLRHVLAPWRMGAPFFRECQTGVLAYVVVRPAMSAAGVLASLLGVAGDGQLRADRAYLWATIANNVSQVCTGVGGVWEGTESLRSVKGDNIPEG